MRLPRPATAGGALASRSLPVINTISFALALLPTLINAVNFQSAPSSNLDLSQLGRFALVGDYDSLSLYNYQGQSEDGLHSNGSQSLLGRYPTGAFASIAQSDASIESMCSFVMKDGTLAGVVAGGNFTSLGGQEAQAVGLYNPSSGAVTPLPGLTGHVNAVYCDQDTETVYVGGNFVGADSMNAIAWTSGWTNLPFAGFNGPVSSIAKLPNGNIIFGGSFTGIGKATLPTTQNAQVVAVNSAYVTSSGTTQNSSYGDPKSIFCTTNQNTDAGHQWLLAEQGYGWWHAEFSFVFTPSKLRLYNTIIPNYSTKSWYLTAFPLNGILNFTYTDDTGEKWCAGNCTLQQNATYQDFYFVNPIQMSSLQIDITGFYGEGAGLGGIELFQNDIISYAVNSFNEPACDDVSVGSNSTVTGNWTTQPIGNGVSGYLSSYLPTGTTDATDLAVIFLPDVKQAGNYSILMYTPGCVGDNTCASRGIMNVTGTLTTDGAQTFSVPLSQTNNDDKIDPIYYGYVNTPSGNFRPSVTLTPQAGQDRALTVVAQQVRFQLVSSDGGLNSLYEWDANNIISDYSTSNIDTAGTSLNDAAQILDIVVVGQTTFIAGAFSTSSYSNIMSITGTNQATSLSDGGLNDVVQTMYYDGSSLLYAGGNFTNTQSNSMTGLNNLAAYDVQAKAWQAVGAGVTGVVESIIPVTVNISAGNPQPCIAVSGFLTEVNAFSGNPAFPIYNVAIWVPSRNNWLHNLHTATISLIGRLNTYTTVPGNDPLYAGAVDSQTLGAIAAAGLSTSGSADLYQLPIQIQPLESSTSALTRRQLAQDASQQQQINGVAAGIFYAENGLNMTILGGHFTATATNGSTINDLVFINHTSTFSVTGLTNNASSSAAIIAMDTHGTMLFAGGSISTGILAYDMARAQLSTSQPLPLSGAQQIVNAIATRPESTAVYVAGSFTQAGELPCAAMCVFNTDLQQWTAPGSGLTDGSTVSVLEWASPTRLVMAGNMTISGNRTMMASYDSTTQKYTTFTNAGSLSSVPGPITAFTAVDMSYSSFFASGIATSNGSAFISRFDGRSTWTTITGLGLHTRIEGLQVLSTSQSHDSSAMLDSSQMLLLTGLIELPTVGNVSAATFDGSSFAPFVLSTMNDGTPGIVRRVFVQNTQNLLSQSHNYLALGFIVLIGLAISLALIFLLVVIGILAERIRRRREGYTLAPTHSTLYEKTGGGRVGDISPERLFQGVHNSGDRPISADSEGLRI